MNSQVISTLEKKYNCPVWVCQDGSLVPMVLMTDKHLAASWKHQTTRLTMVNRIVSDEAQDIIAAMSYFPPDSMAAYYIEQWQEDRLGFCNGRIPSQAEQVRDALLKSTRILRDEAQRRGKPELTPDY